VADLYLFLVEIILIFVAILVTVVKRRCQRRALELEIDTVDDDALHSDLPTALETPAAAAGEGEETVHKGV